MSSFQIKNINTYKETRKNGPFKGKVYMNRCCPLKKDLIVDLLDRLQNNCLKDAQGTKGKFAESQENYILTKWKYH